MCRLTGGLAQVQVLGGAREAAAPHHFLQGADVRGVQVEERRRHGPSEYSLGAPALFVADEPWYLGAMAPLVHYTPPAPVSTEYRVGLCAWQDKSMVDEGTFYPIKSMKAEERLWWYSRFFDCVEVNSTFYAPLSAQNAVLWAKRTPPGFLFSVKAYALLTGHHLDAGRLPEPLAGMLPAAAKADARGRLDNAVFPRRGPRLGVRHVPRGAAAARRRGQARLCPVPDGAVVPPWP